MAPRAWRARSEWLFSANAMRAEARRVARAQRGRAPHGHLTAGRKINSQFEQELHALVSAAALARDEGIQRQVRHALASRRRLTGKQPAFLRKVQLVREVLRSVPLPARGEGAGATTVAAQAPNSALAEKGDVSNPVAAHALAGQATPQAPSPSADDRLADEVAFSSLTYLQDRIAMIDRQDAGVQ